MNKFPVLERHLLLVTRQFEAQTSLLDRTAFQVLFQAMSLLPGLGFYNGGIGAGASQAHKHLQLVPLTNSVLPIHPLLAGAETGRRTLAFPFDHYFQKLKQASPEEAFEAYRQGMASLGLWGTVGQQLGDYNLLCTEQWLLLVPRSRENFQGISVNALGFAGSFLVRNQAEMELIIKTGPMNLLAHVVRA